MIAKFDKFNEDATATLGNTGGMGNVVAANPSSTPGDVAGSTIGSGDIGQTLGTYTKRKKKRKNFNNEQNEPYDLMYVVRFGDYKYTNEGVFGWSYPSGAANDPAAPYNQSDDEYIDIMQYVQDLIIDNDMDEISAENYLDKLDYSDFADLCEFMIEKNPLPWEPISFDGDDNPIYADNEYTNWEKGVRKDNDYKKRQELIRLERRKLGKEWDKKIAKLVYDKLKEWDFPLNLSNKKFEKKKY